MKKEYIIAGVIIVVLIAIGAFALGRSMSKKETANNTRRITNPMSTSTIQSELSQIEQENNTQNFDSLDTDFGADVNAAAQ